MNGNHDVPELGDAAVLLVTTINDQEHQLQRLTNQNTGLTNHVTQQTNQITALNTQVAQLNTNITALNTQVAGFNAQVLGLNVQVVRLTQGGLQNLKIQVYKSLLAFCVILILALISLVAFMAMRTPEPPTVIKYYVQPFVNYSSDSYGFCWKDRMHP